MAYRGQDSALHHTVAKWFKLNASCGFDAPHRGFNDCGMLTLLTDQITSIFPCIPQPIPEGSFIDLRNQSISVRLDAILCSYHVFSLLPQKNLLSRSEYFLIVGKGQRQNSDIALPCPHYIY